MSELITREVNDNGTAVCLINRDGYYVVSVNKDRLWESYDREYNYLFEAYEFFYWALENE